MKACATIKSIAFCCLSALSLAGCPLGPSATRVEGVTVDRPEISGGAGATFVLAATIAPSDAEDQGVTWSSDDEAVATVDPDTGAVVINDVGIATITATTHDGAKKASCVVYGGQLGHWPLRESLDDVSGSGFDGTWRGAPTGAGMSAEPEYVTEGGKTGVHFRYTADEVTTVGSGDWVDCEGGSGALDNDHMHPELAASDYLTVSFWLYWDPHDQLSLDGTTVPCPLTIDGYDRYKYVMNIVSKSIWTKGGWQIRYTSLNGSSDGGEIVLILHFVNDTSPSPTNSCVELSVVKNLESLRATWLHLVVTIDNENRHYASYLNGALAESGDYVNSFGDLGECDADTQYNTGHFSIGAFSHAWGGFSVNGKMSDVRFFRGILDAGDVEDLYEIERAGP